MSVRKVYKVNVNGVQVFSGSYKAALDVYQAFVYFSFSFPEAFSNLAISMSFNPVLPDILKKEGLFDVEKDEKSSP